MKKIGFLSFGHWSNHPAYNTRTAGDTLLQSIDLAVAAEEIGVDGAYFRVHHFASQLASPFPLLSAIGAKTSKIEIGTGVIDMRYENPLYMVEDAGAADLISEGRLQLGISRGSPEQVIDGWRYFGYAPQEGETDAEMGRRKALEFLDRLSGEGFAEPNPYPMFPNPQAYCIWNRTRKDCGSVFGGELHLMLPLFGQPKMQCTFKVLHLSLMKAVNPSMYNKLNR
ncbi:LLM class flavin-dependent oxidoreductase [Pedobacter steynii]